MPFTKQDFLDVLQSLEEQNIFMFNNIQHEEEDLDIFKVQSAKKIKDSQAVVSKLSVNLKQYERRIIDKQS